MHTTYTACINENGYDVFAAVVSKDTIILPKTLPINYQLLLVHVK